MRLRLFMAIVTEPDSDSFLDGAAPAAGQIPNTDLAVDPVKRVLRLLNESGFREQPTSPTMPRSIDMNSN